MNDAPNRRQMHVPDLGEITDSLPRPTMRGALHVIGVIVLAIAGSEMIIAADGTGYEWVMGLYVAGVMLGMATSALYHRMPWSPRWRAFMRRLDHAMIIIWIVASYTPVIVIAGMTTVSWVLMTFVWSLSLVGIALRVTLRTPPRWVRIAVPMVLGLSGFALLPRMLEVLDTWMIVTIIAGGAAYALAAFAYFLKWPNPSPKHFGYHEVMHALTIVGAALHFAAVRGLLASVS